MNYEQRALVQEIKAATQYYTKKKNLNNRSDEALNADKMWNASFFFAKLLFKATPTKERFTYIKIVEYTQQYNKKQGTHIDLESLFDKYWLRNVLDRIFIAGTIDSACRDFDKIKELKSELVFLCQLYSELIDSDKKSLNKKEVEEKIKNFERTNDLLLNREELYKQQWLTEIDDCIELCNIDVYYQPFLDYWNEFLFLNTLKVKYLDSPRKYLISRSELTAVHSKFVSFYPNIPTIDEFIEEKVFSESEGSFLINLHHTDVCYWHDLNEKICGQYWQILVNNTNGIDDRERIKVFLNTTYYSHSSSSKFLENASTEARLYFLKAAYQLIKAESDINGANKEIEKVRLDGEMSRGIDLLLYYERSKEPTNLRNTDYFELFESLEKFEKRSQTTLFLGQSSRHELSFLIDVIVCYDTESNNESDNDENPIIVHYPKVIGLLKESLNKPALLWLIVHYLKFNRPQILSYLLTEPDFISLSFKILDKLDFHEGKTYELKLELWKLCIPLALLSLNKQLNKEPEFCAKILFQIFRELNKDKFQIAHNRRNQTEEELYESQKRIKEETVLSIIEEYTLSNIKQEQYLIPELFNNLVDLAIGYYEEELFVNNFIRFPLLKWDGYIWLLKCSTYWKYKAQFCVKEPEIELLTNSFFEQYLSLLEQDKIKTFDAFEQKHVIKTASWSEKIENMERLSWLYPIYFLSVQQKLPAFLAPRLYPKSSENYYNKENRLIVSKLRTHVAILLQVFRKLINTTIPYGIDKNRLNEIKLRLEQQIIDYLKNHTENIPQKGKVDLFDYQSEWAFNSSEKELLLPQLTRISNWFSKKEEFVDAVARSNDIVKILTIAESIASEGIRIKLLQSIKKADLQKYLEQSHWIPEIQNTLSMLCQYPELKHKTKEVIKFWKDNKISDRKGEYEKYIFQTKLILAYQDNNIQAINKMPLPEKNLVHTISEPSYHHYKQFYTALIHLNEKPENAYVIFNDLAKQFPKYYVFALNRMTAKMKIAANNNHDNNIYRETIEEWQVFSKRNNIKEDTLGLTFHSNKMLVYLHLEEYKLLEKTFVSLDLPDRMNEDVITTKVTSLIAQERIEEALILLDHAESFHKHSKGDKLGFIQTLRGHVSGIDNNEELRLYFNRIFNSSPEKLIQVLPEKFNGKNNINEFITKEVVLASNKMLDKINSASEIKKEDKYNDLVQLALEARLSTFGWSVKDQTRKGFSPSTGTKEENLGEIDLDIQDCNNDSFITCEAFIYRDKGRIQSHIEKVIAHYTNKKAAFIILVYFPGEFESFNKTWKKYTEEIIPKLNYPNGFDFQSKQVLDMSEVFNQTKSAVKVGRSEHGEGSYLYHVFVNLNYQVGK
jgi:hypothetical protein